MGDFYFIDLNGTLIQIYKSKMNNFSAFVSKRSSPKSEKADLIGIQGYPYYMVLCVGSSIYYFKSYLESTLKFTKNPTQNW